jgi:hypothetical protein
MTYTSDLMQESADFAEYTTESSAEDDSDSEDGYDADADVADFESGADFAERAVDAATAAAESGD